MTTTKSYSNANRFSSIYKSSLRQHAPFGVILCIIFFLSITVPFLYEAVDRMNYYSPGAYFFRYAYGVYIDDDFTHGITFIMIVASFVCALFSTSYMHNKRRVDLYHSLPISRATLLSANMLASFTIIMGSFAAVCVLTMLCQLPYYQYYHILTPKYFGQILMEFPIQAVCVLIVYLFTAFISVHVGTVFDALATAGVIGFAPMIVYAVSGFIWTDAIYGATFNPGQEVLLFSPFTFLYRRMDFMSYSDGPVMDYRQLIPFLLGCYAVAACLYFATVFCYRRRKSELAEQTQQSGIMQIIVKCFAGYCGAVLFYYIFDYSLIFRLVAILIGAVLIGLVAELILSRGIRYLRQNWKWLIGTGGACCILLLVVALDLPGYQNRVPHTNNVASVTINYRGHYGDMRGYPTSPFGTDPIYDVTLTDPESIDIVRESHQTALQQYNDNNYDYSWYNVQISYTLKSGASINRNYSRYSDDAYLTLAQLEGQNDFLSQRQLVFLNDGKDIPQAELIRNIYYYDNLGIRSQSISRSDADIEGLLEALRQDMLDETYEDIISPAGPAYGYLEVLYEYPQNTEKLGYTNTVTEEAASLIIVSQDYVRTIALLKQWELGLDAENIWKSVEAVYLTDTYYSYRDNYRIVACEPQNSFRDNYYYDEIDTLPFTEDPQEIKYIYDHSVNQALVEKDLYSSGYVMAYFEVNGRTDSGRLIHMDDLPSSIRQQVQYRFDS